MTWRQTVLYPTTKAILRRLTTWVYTWDIKLETFFCQPPGIYLIIERSCCRYYSSHFLLMCILLHTGRSQRCACLAGSRLWWYPSINRTSIRFTAAVYDVPSQLFTNRLYASRSIVWSMPKSAAYCRIDQLLSEIRSAAMRSRTRCFTKLVITGSYGRRFSTVWARSLEGL